MGDICGHQIKAKKEEVNYANGLSRWLAMDETEQTFIVGDHPYYPLHVELPNYVPNAAPLLVILGAFGGLITIVLSASLALARKYNGNLRTGDQAIFCWFVLCLSTPPYYFVICPDYLKLISL